MKFSATTLYVCGITTVRSSLARNLRALVKLVVRFYKLLQLSLHSKVIVGLQVVCTTPVSVPPISSQRFSATM